MNRTTLLAMNQNIPVSSSLLSFGYLVQFSSVDVASDHLLAQYDPSFTCHVGHLMEKIESLNLLHRAFSVFLFNSKHELLLQVWRS